MQHDRWIKWLFGATIAVVFTACGGGNAGGVDATPPVFTSSNTASVAENQSSAITLVTTDESTVTYSISGGESSVFDIDATTGVVTFKVAPNFEGQDTYGFIATATDSVGNSVTQNVTIHILDIGESPKKTGQTKSYAENGTEVISGNLKDDGFYRSGTAPSYSRDDISDIVTDHVTGLHWADDASVSSVTKQWLTTTNYDICSGSHGQTQNTSKCTDTSGDTVTTYCSTLTLGGYNDWRLPTNKELMGIADKSMTNTPKIDTTYFQHLLSEFYWSSTTYVSDKIHAWGVNFYYAQSNWHFKYRSYYVRCVRDGQ